MVIQRYLLEELRQHFRTNRQMVFLSGPRQVGKTTVARSLTDATGYLNWDNQTHREVIVKGPSAIAERTGLDRLRPEPRLCVLDELHKYQHWRDVLKGFFDQYETRAKVLVTGSASLATFRRGGDSLMGRYFPYTLHPVSVAECVATPTRQALIDPAPGRIEHDQWESLWRFGGFPEPLLKGQKRFFNRWRRLRNEQLFREDLRDLTRIQELGQVEMLANVLRSQVGQLTSYTYLSKSVRVSIDTVRRWIGTLESLYYCFTVRPWHRNVTRALRKEPKYYLWDWSQVADPDARAENLVASALNKAVNWWTESGRGEFSLHFVRDKQKREVDFLVSRGAKPWFLVEVKSSGKAPLSTTLNYFQQQLRASHAFQVVIDADYVESDCFEVQTPVIVPAKTFLAQLI